MLIWVAFSLLLFYLLIFCFVFVFCCLVFALFSDAVWLSDLVSVLIFIDLLVWLFGV